MFQRDLYLKQLIEGKNDHLIKVITGIRRSGKSFLLNKIFKPYLLEKCEVKERNIIQFDFDSMEDIQKLDNYLPQEPTTFQKGSQNVINNRKFLRYISDHTNEKEFFYLLLDEIQNLDDFVRVLNGFLKHDNYDVYVTGSNSRFLSSEVDTEFRGRGRGYTYCP